jgi:Transmembrane secretion effector
MNSAQQKTRRLLRILSAMTMDVTPLRVSRNYRLLYTGQFVSAFGSAISYVVLPWQVYQLTKSTFAVGMLGVAEFVPMFVMAFVDGALADYIDRRRLVMVAAAAARMGAGSDGFVLRRLQFITSPGDRGAYAAHRPSRIYAGGLGIIRIQS